MRVFDGQPDLGLLEYKKNLPETGFPFGKKASGRFFRILCGQVILFRFIYSRRNEA